MQDQECLPLINYEDALSRVNSVQQLDIQATISPNRLLGLWRLMAGFRLPYVIAIICLTISALSRTSSFLLIRYLVDNVLSEKQTTNALLMVAFGFILLAALEGTSSFMSGRLAAMTAEGITRQLRNYLFDHIQRLSYSYHSQTPTGELIQRSTSDVDAIRRFFANQAINIGRVLVLFIINFTTIIILNLTLAWVSIIVIPFIVAVSAFFFKKISKAYEAYQVQEANLSTTLQENLAGVRVVKAFARQQFEETKFEADNKEKFSRGIKLLTLNAVFWPFSDILCAFQMLAGYIVGAFMAIDGSITIGTYMAYIGVVGAIIWPMRNLGRLIVDVSTGLVSYKRVVDVIKQEREPLAQGDYLTEKNILGGVAFDHVKFEYEPGNLVLNDVSFHCQSGDIVALLGSTGSGKTTLVNLLPRFYDVTGGVITIDGIDLRRYPRQYLRKQIGIVEQEPFLFSRSIRENITYGVDRDITDAEVVKAAQTAAIHDVIKSFPEGYQTLVGEKGVTLSGGQKQRVAIARTLLRNPSILILDDSTSSVDTETEALIREALVELMKNRTTFIIAHRIQSIMDANLILVFDKGEIVQSGTHEDLILQAGIYKKIFDIQTRIDLELEKEISDVAV
jgi:ATP-binding cassette subfamily B protein